jgi:hypothetical protein
MITPSLRVSWHRLITILTCSWRCFVLDGSIFSFWCVYSTRTVERLSASLWYPYGTYITERRYHQICGGVCSTSTIEKSSSSSRSCSGNEITKRCCPQLVYTLVVAWPPRDGRCFHEHTVTLISLRGNSLNSRIRWKWCDLWETVLIVATSLRYSSSQGVMPSTLSCVRSDMACEGRYSSLRHLCGASVVKGLTPSALGSVGSVMAYEKQPSTPRYLYSTSIIRG